MVCCNGTSRYNKLTNKCSDMIEPYAGLVLWCLTPLSTVFQLYRGSQFYWWRKQEYQEKTTDLLHVTDKLYYIINVVSSTPRLSDVRTHNCSGDRH
jgi:hypothetical protein